MNSQQRTVIEEIREDVIKGRVLELDEALWLCDLLLSKDDKANQYHGVLYCSPHRLKNHDACAS